MKAIVYTSQTGFTQRYARMLSEKTGVPAWSLAEAKKQLRQGDDVFYMGWLMAGSVKGLDSAMDRYVIRGVGIVGISPQGNGELWTEAKINSGFGEGGARVFYLRGGYAPDRLRGLQRFLMRHMAKSVTKKVQARGDAATSEDLEMVQVFREGGNFVREEQLGEIVEWFASGPHDGALKTALKLEI